MTAPDRYGAIPDIFDVCRGVAQEIAAWAPEYLAAFERQNAITLGETARLTAPLVRHGGAWRRGEQTPACIVWPTGVTDMRRDPDDRHAPVSGTVETHVAIIVGAQPELVGDLLHRHSAVIGKLLLDRPRASGACQRLELVDVDYAGISIEDRGETLAQAELTYLAHGVSLGVPGEGPPPDADPRPDPFPVWPPVDTFLTADLTVTPTPDPFA